MKVLILLLMSFAVWANDENQDPWEDFNRTTFEFNQTLDENIFEPVAKSYKENIPEVAQNRVSDFSSNLSDITTLSNELLQFEVLDSAKTLSRVLINSTIGLFGLFDVASNIGLEKTREDFGQTLAVWGAPQGNYVVLPILGPSTVRDATGTFVDATQNTLVANSLHANENLGIAVVRGVDTRVKLLPATDLLKNSDDPYTTVRSTYFQQRKFNVFDGDLATEEDEF